MDIRRYSIAAAAVAALSLPMSGLAVAQDAAPAEAQTGAEQPMTTEQPAAAANYPDEKLRSFAVAFLEVDAINKQYTPRLQEASTPEEQQQIQEEASKEMVDAVEGSDGINVQEYTSIMQAAQADPDLAQKLTSFIGEASGGTAGGATAPDAPAAQ